MQIAEHNITYHHGQIDPSDYQVDDILRCVAPYPGLLVANLYMVHAVRWHRTNAGVVFAVTVIAHGRFVEVSPVEPVLARTRVVAQLKAADGSSSTHSFADREDLERWCALNRVAPAHCLYDVAANRQHPENTRYTSMCVPGELDDGADSTWFVYDLQARTSAKVGAGAAARELAGRMARTANRSWRAEREGDRG